MTDASLGQLQKLPLTDLDLSQCTQLTSSGLEHLRKLPLKRLSLAGCWKLSDEGLERLQKLPLTCLSLRNCSWVTDRGLARLRNLPLEALDLTGAINVTEAGAAALPETVAVKSVSKFGFLGVGGSIQYAVKKSAVAFLPLLSGFVGPEVLFAGISPVKGKTAFIWAWRLFLSSRRVLLWGNSQVLIAILSLE